MAFFAGSLAVLLFLRLSQQKKKKPAKNANWKQDLEHVLAATSTTSNTTSLPLQSQSLRSLRTPAYLLYLDVAQSNAKTMIARAKTLQCTLRPHVKTHKTLQGGYLQTGGTCRSIVCSTLAEVQFFSQNGFDDILYAVPITPDKLDEASVLSTSMERFSILVDHPVQLNALLARPSPSLSKKWSVVLMVDCGYGRDGVLPTDPRSLQMVRSIHKSTTCEFYGIYTHGGHSYQARTTHAIQRIAAEERDAVVHFANTIDQSGIVKRSNFFVGIGSTPTCSQPPVDGLIGVDEMHPGNYFVYDCTQSDIGSCSDAQVATRVLTRVIGHYKNDDGNMLLIDLGWTGCSAQGSGEGYGRFENHPELYIHALKQEAGEVVSSKTGVPLDLDKYPIGSFLRLMPHHACSAAAMHSKVNVLQTRTSSHVVTTWNSCRGW